jgi:hypothetical protein
VLDNAVEPLRAELRVEVRSLGDGRLPEERRVALELAVGERRVVAELDSARFDQKSTLVFAELQGVSTFRLLAEPKQAHLSRPSLSARLEGDELVIQSDLPVVDLYVWDDADTSTLEENFITLTSKGSRRIRVRGTPGRLRARSLAGEHALRLSGS